MTSQDINFPSGNTPVSLSSFPAAFYLDLNNDGKQDMVVSPITETSAKTRNVWYYSAMRLLPEQHSFELQNKTLLVGDMLDLGSTTHPTFADVNADGLEDLVVGTYGFYSPQASTNARLYLLLNTGTGTNPGLP